MVAQNTITSSSAPNTLNPKFYTGKHKKCTLILHFASALLMDPTGGLPSLLENN